MKLRTKISLISFGLATALVVSLTLLSLYSFREYSIHTAREHVRTAAEIVRVHLTESMIHGTIDRRDGFLDRLSAVEQLKVPVGGGTGLQKTLLIGVVGFPEDGPTFWQAVKFADIALYQAKGGGRNRVVRFAPEMWDGGDKEY